MFHPLHTPNSTTQQTKTSLLSIDSQANCEIWGSTYFQKGLIPGRFFWFPSLLCSSSQMAFLSWSLWRKWTRAACPIRRPNCTSLVVDSCPSPKMRVLSWPCSTPPKRGRGLACDWEGGPGSFVAAFLPRVIAHASPTKHTCVAWPLGLLVSWLLNMYPYNGLLQSLAETETSKHPENLFAPPKHT